MLLCDKVSCALYTLSQHRDLPLNLCAERELKEGETKTRETHLTAALQDKDGKGFNCSGGNGAEKRKWRGDQFWTENTGCRGIRD